MLTLSSGHSAEYLTGAVAAGRENYYTGAVAAGEPPEPPGLHEPPEQPGQLTLVAKGNDTDSHNAENVDARNSR